MSIFRKIGFQYAFSGIRQIFKNEFNIKIHLIAATLVIIAGYLFQVSKIEWMFLLLAIMSVFVCEIFNSAIEVLCDFITEDRNPKIKLIKDLSAGAVLISAIFAAIIGFIIFLPKLIALLQ